MGPTISLILSQAPVRFTLGTLPCTAWTSSAVKRRLRRSQSPTLSMSNVPTVFRKGDSWAQFPICRLYVQVALAVCSKSEKSIDHPEALEPPRWRPPWSGQHCYRTAWRSAATRSVASCIVLLGGGGRMRLSRIGSRRLEDCFFRILQRRENILGDFVD